MTRTTAIALTATLLLAASHRAAAQTTSNDPRLEQRVTISFQNARAFDVITTMARVVGAAENGGKWRVYFCPEDLLPVTITLTNVKLRTALDAVCQTAQCNWEIGTDGILLIRRAEEPVAALPRSVSIRLSGVSPQVALQAIAAALNVTLIIETVIPAESEKYPGVSNWSLDDADAKRVLRLLSDITGCVIELNERDRTLKVSARKQ